MSLSAGTRLGPYEITGALGSGGMGEVYRAIDTRLDRAVAIKVLPAHLAADQTAISRFQREARAVAALSHPNILALYDVGSSNGVAYAVTELLEGHTLRDRLQSGPLDPRHAVMMGVQLVRGLAAAHEKGIVHRDLKPENLFITHSGQLKILDFGLAQQTVAPSAGETVAATRDTSPGMVLGTVGYMSPEQVRGLPTDHRTDLFAVGAVLYEMLGGRRAFAAETAADTMAAIVRDHPPALDQLNASTPPAITRIVARCLEKNAGARFQSAHDLAFALESLSQHGSAPSEPHRVEGAGRLETATAADEAKSLVVLPFEDLSPERDNAYFADGLTDEIISDLSKIRGLRVISRNSSMQLKSRERDIATIARDLKVQYVLDGSVRKAGPRLRITAELVDTSTNTQVWSDKYNGTIDDVFEIQEQVSRAIAGELKGKLTKEESRELAQRPVHDPRAYEYYLRARAGVSQFTAEGARGALADVEQGLAIAGDNPSLLAVQGEIYWQAFNLGIVTDPAQLQKVADIATRIEQLDPQSPHISRLRAMVAVHTANLQQSVRDSKRSLAQDPNDPMTGIIYVFGCAFAGHPEAATTVAKHVGAIDPLQPISQIVVPILDYWQGRFDAAGPGLAHASAMHPRNPAITLMYAQWLAAAGRVGEAIETIDRLVPEQSNDNWTSLNAIFKFALQGDDAGVDASLTPNVRDWCTHDPQYSLLMAEAHALLGRADDAFWWLEQLLSLGACPHAFVAAHNPFLARIRGDVRWAPMIERMRRAWEQFET